MQQILKRSYYTKIAADLNLVVATMNVSLGLNASNEDLDLKVSSTWAFGTSSNAMGSDNYHDSFPCQ